MFRFTIRDVLWLTVVVLIGAFFGGSLNAAVSSGPEEVVYQAMRGIVAGGCVAAIFIWIGRLYATTPG